MDTEHHEHDEPPLVVVVRDRSDHTTAGTVDVEWSARLARAMTARRDLARQSVASAFGRDPDVLFDTAEPVVGAMPHLLAGFDVSSAIEHLLSRAVADAGRGRAPAVMLASTDALDRDVASFASPPALARRLDQGWVVSVVDPDSWPDALGAFDAMIRTGWPGARSVLVHGIASALGPPPRAAENPRVMLQLAGERSVLLHGPQVDQLQVRLQAGQAVVVPRGCTASHLPLDLASAYLDYELVDAPGDATAATLADGTEASSRPGLRAARQVSLDDALHVGSTRFADGWPMRLIPATDLRVTVDSTLDDTRRLALDGRCVDVRADGLGLIEFMANDDHVAPAEAADRLGLDRRRVVEAMHELWVAGLAEPAPRGSAIRVNERLTQVASVELDDPTVGQSLLDAADPNAWRPPADGEVHGPVASLIDVQPLPTELGVLGNLRAIARSMNQQFFGLDLTRSLHEPELLVRVRANPGSSRPVAPDVEALGSDLVAHPSRKLTWLFSVGEHDADGGWPRLAAGSKATTSAAGGLAAWPSFRPWYLSPITRGERVFVLGRLHGNAWC